MRSGSYPVGEQADGCRAAEVRSADVAAGRARLTRFPNLEQIKDPEDRKLRIAEAEAAVGLLSYIIKDYEADLAEAEKQIAAIQARAAQAAALRRFNDDLESVKSKFIELQKETDGQRRYKVSSG